jgi:2'-hydroxyisoflavone reductase
MPLTRRTFSHMVATGATASAFGIAPSASGERPRGSSPKPLRLLILGGTGFIGPYQVRYAVERGHRVTVFNRGRQQAGLPKSVVHLQGDRNDDLSALERGEWDVVIDNPTTLPFWVRDAASLLKGRAGQYIFISTISVYADLSEPGTDETAALAPYTGADPMAETMDSLRADMTLYGPLKALSEREAEKWFPGRTTIIRPGLIVGPGDPTDRFTYWPVRVSRGGDVLAPGSPGDPVQVIDARDLAEWTIRMAEANVTGVYNATGPAPPMGIGAMLESMRPLASDPVTFTFANAGFLESQGVGPWMDMPTWVPPKGSMGGMSRVSIARAVNQGLTFRPIEDTAHDTLAWFRSLPAERQSTLRAGITTDREAAVLTAWHRQQAS